MLKIIQVSICFDILFEGLIVPNQQAWQGENSTSFYRHKIDAPRNFFPNLHYLWKKSKSNTFSHVINNHASLGTGGTFDLS
jgi:hypothetical protein